MDVEALNQGLSPNIHRSMAVASHDFSRETEERRGGGRGEGLGLQGCASARPRQGLALIGRLAAGYDSVARAETREGAGGGGGMDAALPGTGSPDVRRSPPEGPESTAEGSAVLNRRGARRKRRHGQNEPPKFRA
ncbi:hypothetical protein THAOC_24578, partial [Thalassiosira oceanica]